MTITGTLEQQILLLRLIRYFNVLARDALACRMKAGHDM